MLRFLALLSGLYDVVVGAFLLFAPDTLPSVFGVSPARPRIFADLHALFLIAVGIGFYQPWRDPQTHRGYMWVMGVVLKGSGAAAFIAHYFLRDPHAAFLLFAASDGLLAGLTLIALLRDRSARRR